MPVIDYSAVSRLEFTDNDIIDVITAAETTGFREGKVLASLNLANFMGETVNPAVLTEFAKLALVLKLPVSKAHAGLEVKRDLTPDEARDVALDALRYGYGDTAKRIRAERAAEQGIDIYKPETEA
jgi:hypothetical protein